MKAKVLWKFGGKVKLYLEDGRFMVLQPDEVKSVNPAMRWGDYGTLTQVNDKVKFIPYAEEVDLRPIAKPDTIRTPTEEDNHA